MSVDGRGDGSARPPKAEGKVASFYLTSRLHFLGTWRERFDLWRSGGGAEAADLVDSSVLDTLRRDLAEAKDPCAMCTGTDMEPGDSGLWAYLDMDCFFVAVALRDSPASMEQPTAVASGVGDGSEICSANYAARRAGISTHRLLASWKEVLPSLRIIPVTGQLLHKAEALWYQAYRLIVEACDGDHERVIVRSCDEAVIRVPETRPDEWAKALQAAVVSQTRCSCSVGLGFSQIVAKLAVTACKPRGLRRISRSEQAQFLAETPIASLPKVGHALEQKLEQRGLRLCSDVLALDRQLLRRWFGAKGEMMHSYALGEDFGDVDSRPERKTVSAEINFGVRVSDRSGALAVLAQVARELATRLESADISASQITLKAKVAVPGWASPPHKKGGHGECDDVSRSLLMPRPSREAGVLLEHGASLLDAAVRDPSRIKGIGLACRVASAGSAAPGRGQAGIEAFFRASGRSSGAHEIAGPAYPPTAPEEVSAPACSAAAPSELVETPCDGSSGAAAPRPCGVVIDLEESDGEEMGRACSPGGNQLVAATAECPVCNSLVPMAEVEAHVNRHFDLPQQEGLLAPAPSPRCGPPPANPRGRGKTPRKKRARERSLLDFVAAGRRGGPDAPLDIDSKD